MSFSETSLIRLQFGHRKENSSFPSSLFIRTGNAFPQHGQCNTSSFLLSIHRKNKNNFYLNKNFK
jgi:hypothetical protein